MPARDMAASFRALERHVVDGAGHWVHQEEPDRVNALLLAHLARTG
jgi:pimeloyl-ACP methyl ester carboxylesterase